VPDRPLESTRTLKAGAGLAQQFSVTGVPTPAVAWSLNGQPLPADAAVVSTAADLTSLAVKKCSVRDAGLYEVTAANDVGTDTVRFTVVVNGTLYRVTEDVKAHVASRPNHSASA